MACPTKQLSNPWFKLGFDVVAFSGDKLLEWSPSRLFRGHKRRHSKASKASARARALRCDKMQLAAAIATLELYIRGEAEQSIPLLRSMNQTTEKLRDRCVAWQSVLGQGEVIETPDAAGGGTLPGVISRHGPCPSCRKTG